MVSISQNLKDNRREEVKELYFIRNYTVKEILRYFTNKGQEWQERVIFKDIAAIRHDFFEKVNMLDIQEILRRRLMLHERNMNRIHRSYDKEQDPYRQCLILYKIEELENKFVLILQELGLVPKIAENVNLNFIHGLEEATLVIEERKKARVQELALKNVRSKDKKQLHP